MRSKSEQRDLKINTKTYVESIASIAFLVLLILIMLILIFLSLRTPPSSSSLSLGGGLQQTKPEQTPIITFDDLLDAIEQVESGGDANAVGDKGNAIGSFQIWKIYVDDLNRINRAKHTDKYSTFQKWEYYHRKNRACSRIMTKEYIEHYATEKRLKRSPTFEDMARIHNGGPNGYMKESTEKYWRKIKKELAK